MVSIPKTALQLLGLPPLGVPRLHDDPGLADLVDLTPGATPTPLPPAYGSTIVQPPAPDPTPPPPDTRRSPSAPDRSGSTYAQMFRGW